MVRLSFVKNLINPITSDLFVPGKKRGIFYNSIVASCSIYSTGVHCYNTLKLSSEYTLDYSEKQTLYNGYDFIIVNWHHTVNKWITGDIIKSIGKPSFAIVTEVGYKSDNAIDMSLLGFHHYIVLDPTVAETNNIHPFPRPLQQYEFIQDPLPSVVTVGTFGYATHGKGWKDIITDVRDSFEKAIIKFNIPHSSYAGEVEPRVNAELESFRELLKGTDIDLIITHDYLSDEELVKWCSKNTINVFLYDRTTSLGFRNGLAATPDQCISSGRPLLVSEDPTFRHIHPYIESFPKIGIKEAITKNIEGVLKMKEEWSPEKFLQKFEGILRLT